MTHLCSLCPADVRLSVQEETVSQAETQTVPHQTHGEGLRQEPLMNTLSPDTQLCGLQRKHSEKIHSKTLQRFCETKVTCTEQAHTHTHTQGTYHMLIIMICSRSFAK